VTISNAQFRADFPEFSSTTVYPNAQLTYWNTVALLMLNAVRWGSWLDMATELFMAHNVALEARAMAEAANGDVPGVVTGPITAKSADKVSLSFGTDRVTDDKAGHWNQTIYGLRLWKLFRLIGAGPIQLGYETNIDPLSSAAAWPSPWYEIPNPSGSG
jgi:hypothetical protein